MADRKRDLGRSNGTFLVLRQLEQNVKSFELFTQQAAQRLSGPDPAAIARTAGWIAAKMIGRWPDGSSLVRNPTLSATDYAAFRARAQNYTSPAAPAPDNDFRYGVEDPQARRCPFGAHIRRGNPRDSFEPGSTEAVAINNRHRILRRGRVYTPAASADPGLLFACLNSDIERQFEFIQQTWTNNARFHGLSGEMDPMSPGNSLGQSRPKRVRSSCRASAPS